MSVYGPNTRPLVPGILVDFSWTGTWLKQKHNWDWGFLIIRHLCTQCTSLLHSLNYLNIVFANWNVNDTALHYVVNLSVLYYHAFTYFQADKYHLYDISGWLKRLLKLWVDTLYYIFPSYGIFYTYWQYTLYRGSQESLFCATFYIIGSLVFEGIEFKEN